MIMMDFIVAFTEPSDARCFLREVGGWMCQGRVSDVVEHLHIKARMKGSNRHSVCTTC